jgi:biopolymer transport protein ExbD
MMAKKNKAPHGGAADVNLTPMIDCTFQLIIFFILTAQMASEQAKVLISTPIESMALSVVNPESPPFPNKVTVNVCGKFGDTKQEDRDPSKSGAAEYYQIGQKKIEVHDIDGLIEILKEAHAQSVKKNPKAEFFVEIRADKDVEYAEIEPVLLAAGEAKMNRMTITAEADREKQSKLQPGLGK